MKFKRFAGIGAFDIELNVVDPQQLIEVIAALEPTFGGINLEDIHISLDPSPEQIAQITRMAEEEVRRFGIESKVALLLHSSFGARDALPAVKMPLTRRHAMRAH